MNEFPPCGEMWWWLNPGSWDERRERETLEKSWLEVLKGRDGRIISKWILASYPMGNRGSFPGGKSGRTVKLTTHLHLVPRSRMHWAIPPLLQYVFIAWCLVKHKKNFTFAEGMEWIHIEEFWVVTLCSVAVGYQRFEGPCCLHLQGEVEWIHLPQYGV